MADEQEISVPFPLQQPHILAFPLPKQGHINPLLQFSKQLASRGIHITLLIPSSIANSLPILPNSDSIEIAPISEADETDVLSERFRALISKAFADYISKSETKRKPNFIIYDSLMPWILTVAKRFGIDAAPFFTQSCAVNYIYELIRRGDLKIDRTEEDRISFPSLPILEFDDLPITFPGVIGFVDCKISQLLDLKEVKWMICNTFDQLENTVIKEVASQWPIKTVGPLIPSAYLKNGLEKDNNEYGISLFNSNTYSDDSIIHWLNSKDAASVIFLSFGTVVSLEESQVKEIASSLRDGSRSFIWVLGESEKKKLPNNFVEETSKKGLVVSWCSQLQVLAHTAIGCFVSHCGWNSTLEALSLGIPMVAVPKWSDQTINSKFIADVWEIGVRAKVNEKGIFTKDEIEKCVGEVMEGERGREIRKNSLKWKELAKEAMVEGGSSHINIDEFVKELMMINSF